MSGVEAPDRPDAPRGASRPGRRWLPVWLVIGVIAVTTLGGFVTAAALPAADVGSLRVGSTVTIHPLRGWIVVHRERATLGASDGRAVPATFAQLSPGNGALDIVVIVGLGSGPEEAASFYAGEVLRDQLDRATFTGLTGMVLRSGLSAVRFSYVGTEPRSGVPIEGSVTVAVGGSGNVAVFDGWSSEGQLPLIEDDLDRMIETAEVG
jgi:hypothetical protein